PPGRPGRRGGGDEPGGRRPALALPARPARDHGVGPPDRPRRRRARGPDLRRPRRGALGPDHRGLLLPPRGAGPAGRRLQRALPAEPARGGLPPRPRPGPRRRRAIAEPLTARAPRPSRERPIPVAIKE